MAETNGSRCDLENFQIKVANKLPKANLLLLQHLLSLLSDISRNVATSKMTSGNLAICLAPNLLSPPQELPLDILAQETQKVTQLLEFLIDQYEELLIDQHKELLGEEVAGLASEGEEEPPAPQAEPETAEVPPVASESKHPRSFSREKRLPGSAQESRRCQATCEEGSDGPLCRKRSRLSTELSGVGN
ncbi:T-cell activation Rho GTPase-activating protein-like isoform X2 [Strigops habroptila]|uniref:T-cell activation Rho GTPase-activating protein-like isoform X2 n=1 Tax=Strigops habroptila TaxID=2489341 RepID=UPI0011CF01AC|nr:T-cell activation Rho GTPase-activating protein-like isoform X2 [Strigops habroptila]